jgi:hypothetical protein
MTDKIPTAREQSIALRPDDPKWPSCLAAAEIRYRLKWARSQNRFWYYDRASRQPTADDPTWRSRRWPWFGGDEYGRKTIVIPIPFHGEFVWAFWTWKGVEDDEMRQQTMNFAAVEANREREFESTFILVDEDVFVDVKHDLDDCDLKWTMYYEGDPEDGIPCAAYPLDWNTLRLYPIDSVEAMVTVRVEVDKIGTGIKNMSGNK